MTNTSKRWLPHVSVAAVIEKNQKFLLVEELIEGKLLLNQPAGHWENNETLLEAVVRETLEETAWHFKPTFLIGIYQWQHPSRTSLTYLRFAFGGELLTQDLTLDLDEGIERTVWLSKQEIYGSAARHRSPQLIKCVDDYLSGQELPLSCLHTIT